MNNNSIIESDQNEEEDLFVYEISDEMLENTGSEKAAVFTQWVCTAVYYCPGP
jgi:hypothetical protein